CHECAAPPGCGCDPASPVLTEMIRMAKSPPLMIHTRRMADAITAGAVRRHAIVAQFQGNPLPVAVARAVAATRRRPASRSAGTPGSSAGGLAAAVEPATGEEVYGCAERPPPAPAPG